MAPFTDGAARVWQVAGRAMELDRPLVAGVLNVTPDSFSDGGRFVARDDAVRRAHEMVEEGAAIIDIGAESSRPGSDPVSVDEEWSRLEPVLRELTDLSVPLSIDTTKADVAARALDLGAAIINDISALEADPGIAPLAAEHGAGLVLMHMRGTPRTMQENTAYDDVVRDVCGSLESARARALDAGCSADQIALDPGLGFGKSVEGNLELIARLDELADLGSPVWIGPSRKSFLGELLDAEPSERLHGTIAAGLVAADHGADVLRVHDVRPMVEALRVQGAIEAARPSSMEVAG